MHAKIAASQYQNGSPTFYMLFKEFVRLFKESEFDESYLSADTTVVTHAYWKFLNCIRGEVTGSQH
ncbi:hypothetical protein K440DRAFT_622049 [Wilcoxina mikolae CBS 423.85]|nr:hypothetical protein K440DRAFT_622049 [Wilcoxina mikolae CBS 423.85]